jgi:hypothetical protein
MNCDESHIKESFTPSEQDGEFEFVITNKLPRWNIKPEFWNEMPADLSGGKILHFGAVDDKNICRGLGIEYITKEGLTKSIIFEFDETGLWVSYK